MHLLLCVVLFPFCRATLNPVARNFSDPSIYHEAVNKLVSFASSHGESNVPIARSTNGINWCSTSDYTCGNTSDAFPDVPAWVQPGSTEMCESAVQTTDTLSRGCVRELSVD